VKKAMWLCLLPLLAVAILPAAGMCAGEDGMSSILNVQKYDRAIHIMAMLLVGFGFLMVFVKKYGRSALTATFLLVSTAIPIYICINSFGWMGKAPDVIIDELIMAEFAAASLLICAGAVLGRMKMPQYLVLGALFVPCYMFNEWIILENGFGIIPVGRFADTGGSIVIHAFGALFGLGVAMTMTTAKEYGAVVETDNTSDRLSLLGSMVLWLFWPSFCSALVPPELVPMTVVNVILALCGATLATYIATISLRRKISVADIANASLAGGVAIGSTCDHASPMQSIVIGILAGALSTFGFAIILPWLQKTIHKIDTCGVMYLHGLPGLMGGLVAMVVVKGLSGSDQMKGIAITIVISLVAGYVVGKIVSAFGHRAIPYVDSEEFAEAD
jgi:ammonium transporter Rh